MRRIDNRAMTFIEVILAVVLCSIIAGNIYALMFQGMRVDSRTEMTAERHWMMYQALYLIEKDLQGMIPYQARDDEKINFSGQRDAIKGVVRTDQGLREVSYFLRPLQEDNVHKVVIGERYSDNRDMILSSGTGQKVYELVRLEKAFPAINVKDSDCQEMVVVRGLTAEGLRIFYVVLNEEGERREWVDGWEKDGIPQAAKVELDFLATENFSSATLSREIFIPAGMMFLLND